MPRSSQNVNRTTSCCFVIGSSVCVALVFFSAVALHTERAGLFRLGESTLRPWSSGASAISAIDTS